MVEILRLKTSWDGHYMRQAYIDFLHFALGNDDILKQFREETGILWQPARNGLEKAIDEATGVEFKFLQQFSDWCETRHYGTPADMDRDMPL